MSLRVHRHVRVLVNDVLAQHVALFHECVEVVSRRVHRYPARMVAVVWAGDGAEEGDGGRGGFEAVVHPELVGVHVC